MAKENTKPAKAANKEQEESKMIYISGIVSLAMYGKRVFQNGKSDKEDKYRLSIKLDDGMLDKLREDCAPFYDGVDDSWRPKWLEEDTEFLNLSSNYDIRIGVIENGHLADRGTMCDFIADNGSITGSKAVFGITVKPGALYPAAILIKELKIQSIDDFFNAKSEGLEDFFDELPF